MSDEDPQVAVPRVGPSETSRAMMRALADKMSMSLPMGAGVITAGVERAIDALRTGRLDLFLQSRVDVALAMDGLAGSFAESDTTDKAIEALDPAYARAVDYVRRRFLIASRRREYAGLDTTDLVGKYAMHRMGCPNPDTCDETIAMHEELASRGLKVTK